MGHLILFKKKYHFSIVEWYVNKKVASFLISVSWFPNKKQQVEVSQGVILTTGIYLYSVLNLPYLECLSLKKKRQLLSVSNLTSTKHFRWRWRRLDNFLQLTLCRRNITSSTFSPWCIKFGLNSSLNGSPQADSPPANQSKAQNHVSVITFDQYSH